MHASRIVGFVVVLLLPVAVFGQWATPTASSIETACATPPCTVVINPGNTTNSGLALDARGDIFATGTSIDVAAISNSGPAALSASAPAAQVATVLLRSGGAEAVHLRREATSNDFTIYTANTERMRILASNGRIGIGLSPTGARLQVLETGDSSIASSLTVSTQVEANAQQLDYGLIVNAVQNNQTGVVNTGRIIGAYIDARNSGAGQVTYSMGGRFFGGVQTNATGTVDQAYGLHAQVVNGGTGTVNTGYGVYINDTQATNDFGLYQSGTDDANYLAGNTGIGGAATANKLEVYGNANVSGTITGNNVVAKYQDVAEWVPSTHDLAPGTVVVLNPDAVNEVMASTRAYDTAVAGVVSAQPGVLLGEAGPAKEQIATTGRVKVRVDARAAAVRVGDLLVTSDLPGTAMKSQPVQLGGRAMHQPGTIIGKALEPLREGVGEILVLLSMQ